LRLVQAQHPISDARATLEVSRRLAVTRAIPHKARILRFMRVADVEMETLIL